MFILVTICKHQVKDWVDPLDLDSISLQVLSGLTLDTFADELQPKYLQLHRHCLVRVPKKWRYTITSLDGYRIYYDKVLKGQEQLVRNYIHKNDDECHTECNYAYHRQYLE